jgi:hypothetical protein
MNIDEKIQLNGYKVDSGVCYAYFPNDQVSVTNKISHSNVQIVENGCNDNEFEEIDSECQCDVVNYNEHDGDSDDLNGNNDNDFEGGDSQFQNEVADYYKHDSESGDDFNKDHYQRNHDCDGNGFVNNPDCDDTFCHDDDNVVDEDDPDDEDIGYCATKTGQDDDMDDGLVYYQCNEFNKNTTATVRYCDSSEDSGNKGYNDNSASEYLPVQTMMTSSIMIYLNMVMDE